MERARMECEDRLRLCKLMYYTSELENEREELQDQRGEIRAMIADAQESLDTYLCGGFSTGATPIQHVRDARRILANTGHVIVNEALSDTDSDDSSDDES